MKKDNYSRFFLMLIMSFIVMYSVMFFNVYESSHIYLSLTRLYMTLLMVSSMSIFMLLIMIKMYPNKNKNIIIISVSILIFTLSLIFLRTQIPIGDVQYMKAMIPHHSSAILTSNRANLQDPEVRELADQIIISQEKEIQQMKDILGRLK